jgi:hypothetical protein
MQERFARMRVVNRISHGVNEMRKILLPLLAGAALTAVAAGSASAQSVGIYVGTPYAYGYDDDVSYGYVAVPERRVAPRRYGYVSGSGDIEVRARDHNGTCGTFYYWNGDRCVDARNR